MLATTSERLRARLDAAAHARNRRRLLALNRRHRGATVFVIGAGPQLNRLSAAARAGLEQAVTIGVSRTQYRIRPTYLLSAYSQEIALGARTAPRSTLIHMSGAPPVVRGSITVRRRRFHPGDPLPRLFFGVRPYLLTNMNVALAATHLALILGARRVCYVGVEGRTSLHFYDEDERLRRQMIDDLDAIEQVVWDADHVTTASRETVLALLRTPIEELADVPFEPETAERFRAYFDELERYGVEPVTTLEDSVVADAGARFVELDDLLAASVQR